MQDWGMTLIQGHNYMYVIACCYILGIIQYSNNHVAGPSTPFHTQWLFFPEWVLFYLMIDMLALNKVPASYSINWVLRGGLQKEHACLNQNSCTLQISH